MIWTRGKISNVLVFRNYLILKYIHPDKGERRHQARLLHGLDVFGPLQLEGLLLLPGDLV